MSNLYKEPSIDAAYQVSVHLAEGFQRRLKCEKLTNDGRQVMAKAHLAFAKKAVCVDSWSYKTNKQSFQMMAHAAAI